MVKIEDSETCPLCVRSECMYHGCDKKLMRNGTVADYIEGGVVMPVTPAGISDYFPINRFQQLYQESQTQEIVRQQIPPVHVASV